MSGTPTSTAWAGYHKRYVTANDFLSIPGVCRVHKCDPEPGHVTLLVEPEFMHAVRCEVDEHVPASVMVHYEAARS